MVGYLPDRTVADLFCCRHFLARAGSEAKAHADKGKSLIDSLRRLAISFRVLMYPTVPAAQTARRPTMRSLRRVLGGCRRSTVPLPAPSAACTLHLHTVCSSSCCDTTATERRQGLRWLHPDLPSPPPVRARRAFAPPARTAIAPPAVQSSFGRVPAMPNS